MISLQTNTDSIGAQNNLNTNHNFQSKTIQQLTSGFRINSSGDDAAGLAIANSLRDSIAELTQGVANANSGVAQLQIVDGGLSNISTILDRMKTLATQSASGTFTGDRNTLNKEYQGLISEINRQASNINLNSGGTFNQSLSVYIGGANTAANATVNIDLSGAKNAVDATSLGLSSTTVAGAGTSLTGNARSLTTPGATFVTGATNQTFTFNVTSATGATSTVSAVITASAGGSSLSTVLNSLNSTLNSSGITAGTDANGKLQFTGSNAFTVSDSNSAGAVTNGLSDYAAYTAGGGVGAGKTANGANYVVDASSATAVGTGGETLKFQTSTGNTVSVNLAAAATVAAQITAINTATASYGITATAGPGGTGISFQSANSFTINDANGAGAGGVFNGAANATSSNAAAAPTGAPNGTAAISALNQAIQNLGLVQGSIGAGENKLQYAINLASSQIANFSTAQSQIRDTDVAAAAANLTKGQVLTQASIAAMAQANSEPQSVLKLLG